MTNHIANYVKICLPLPSSFLWIVNGSYRIMKTGKLTFISIKMIQNLAFNMSIPVP